MILMLIILCLPAYNTGVPWEDDFDWAVFNYTPLVVGVRSARHRTRVGTRHENRYAGPIRQVEFDEGMGIVEEKPAEPPPERPAT